MMTANEMAFYREATEKANRSVLNSIGWNYTFRCGMCKETKPFAGRVKRGWQKGYRCADCEAKRLAVKLAMKGGA